MFSKNEELFRKAMDRTIADNKRIAQENLRSAALSGNEIINPLISKAFLNVIRQVSGKKAQ